MKSLFTWAALLAAAALLVVPSELRADRSPIRELHPPYAISDPEVPDGRMPSRAFSTDHRAGVVEDAPHRSAAPRPQALRPERWYEKVLRILRALALGGPVR